MKDRIFQLLVTKLEEPETEIKKCVCGMRILAWMAKAKQVTGKSNNRILSNVTVFNCKF